MHRVIGSLAVAASLLHTSVWAGSPALESSVPVAVAIALQRHDAGTFYIGGAIKGYGELQLLVDTGSSYLVINETILSELKATGNAQYSRDLSGTMADGTRRIIPVYRIAGLRLGEACWISDVEAAVFPGNSRAILGMNVLARLAPFTFSAEPAQLALNQCQAPVTDNLATVTIQEPPLLIEQ